MNISNKTINVKNKKIEVLSDIGFVPINYIIKTVAFKKYLVLFESGIEIECADNHAFIDIKYNTILAKNLKEGDKIISKDGFDTVFDVFDTGIKEEMYDLNLQNHHLYYTNNILSHNSNLMANMAARQVMNGHNVVLMSLEMSENMFAQRFDSIYSLLDINRIYTIDEKKQELVRRLRDIKSIENRGELFIKQFPTGEASVLDFKRYLRELLLRGIKIDILYADYINLMKTAYKTENSLYSSVKKVSEELRALSFEFKVPVVSVSQLNREGSFVGFEEINFNYIAECLDLNTIVRKRDGIIKISKLKVGDEIKGSDGYVKVLNIWPKKVKTKYKIRTKSGKEIICSSDHKFPTDDGIKSINTGLKIGDKFNVL